MKKIVTVTLNPTIDKNSQIDHVVSEKKLRCQKPRYEPGGGGVNVSRAIKKLGGTSSAFYLAGGPPGQILTQLLDEEEIDHHPLPIKGWSRENLTIYEEGTGLQYRFGMPGPSISNEEWQNCLDVLTSLNPRPDYLVASGSLPPESHLDSYALIAKIGKKLGSRVIIDTSGEALRLASDSGIFLLKPNLRELSDLSGVEIKNEYVLKETSRKIIQKMHCELIIVSLGAAGVLAISKEGSERIQSPIVPVVSKIGSGDSMVAGIVLSLARGNTLHDAVLYGVAAGAAAVMTPGTELCRSEDTERLYSQMKKSRHRLFL